MISKDGSSQRNSKFEDPEARRNMELWGSSREDDVPAGKGAKMRLV